MSRFWRIFMLWAGTLTILAVVANLPNNGGPLKLWVSWAGCPWVFVGWNPRRLIMFDAAALAADVVVWGAAIVVLAYACAWARTRSRTATSPPPPARAGSPPSAGP